MRQKNTFFQFKQFRVVQQRSAMKVCTDSCLLGAVAVPGNAIRILDIGSGTGLLALMLAQKSKAEIIALEIEHEAFEESVFNFQNSPWHDRLRAEHISLQQYARNCTGTFDFIISNPPFFARNLPSGDRGKNIALHAAELTLKDLTEGVDRLLSGDGTFVYMLPVHESGNLKALLNTKGIMPVSTFLVKEWDEKSAIREIVCCTRLSGSPEEHEVVIRGRDGNYSDTFRQYLKDYYLIF